MKTFWEKWKYAIGIVGGIAMIVSMTLAFSVKARNVATSEQVEAARTEAVEVHRKDFAELTAAWQEQRAEDKRDALIRERRGVQREMWDVEDRMGKEGRTPYLVERWRALKQQMEDIDRILEELLNK